MMLRMCTKWTALVAVVLFHLLVLTSANQTNVKRFDQHYSIWKTIGALKKLALFYQHFYKDINLDGVVGIQLAAAELRNFLHQISTEFPHDDLRLYLLELKELQKIFESIGDKSIAYVKTSDPQYFKSMGFVLDRSIWQGQWTIQEVPLTVINKTEFNQKIVRTSFDENQSDSCIRNLQDCTITDMCMQTMFSPGQESYWIAHQLLFYLIGERLQCNKEIETIAFNKSVKEVKQELCSNILAEANSIAAQNFPIGKRDLFLEQIALCGIAGFQEFFKPKWLKEILKWQNTDTGCYNIDSLGNTEMTRQKREDKLVGDNCSAHTSAVAVAALAQFVTHTLHQLITHSVSLY